MPAKKGEITNKGSRIWETPKKIILNNFQLILVSDEKRCNWQKKKKNEGGQGVSAWKEYNKRLQINLRVNFRTLGW